MLKLVTRFCRDEEGATAIEYGLIAALISVAGITAFMQVGNSVSDMFTFISDELNTATNSI